jgi:hypothetical protein
MHFASASPTVTISNTKPRRDVDGVIMDAHDGNVVQWKDGTYYPPPPHPPALSHLYRFTLPARRTVLPPFMYS